MDFLITLINSQGFINFISTFGLAVFLVLYFVFIRDPQREKYWQKNYDQLLKDRQEKFEQLVNSYNNITKILNNIQTEAGKLWKHQCDGIREQNQALSEQLKELSQIYKDLEHDLRPGTRIISNDQAIAIADLGLDRDLYKLIYYMREKLEGREKGSIRYFISDSVLETNRIWEKFITPLPKYPHIKGLYPLYKNNGIELEKELSQITEEGKSEEGKSEEKTMERVWNLLVNETIEMKRHFSDSINKKGEITEYKSTFCNKL